MKNSRLKTYSQRFSRVFDYIDAHLDEELSVEQLSAVANFSKFHFHRQFSDYAGITVTRYVQLMRLRRASYRLIFNPEARITDIAHEAGFENSESFSRAFKGTFSQTLPNSGASRHGSPGMTTTGPLGGRRARS